MCQYIPYGTGEMLFKPHVHINSCFNAFQMVCRVRGLTSQAESHLPAELVQIQTSTSYWQNKPVHLGAFNLSLSQPPAHHTGMKQASKSNRI